MNRKEIKLALRGVWKRLRDVEDTLPPAGRMQVVQIREAVGAIGKQMADDEERAKDFRGRRARGC